VPARVPVKNWMSGDPVVIAPTASALEAFDIMLERGIRHLPVVDERGVVVGVLSLDDLRAALPFPVSRDTPLLPDERSEAREWSVTDVMTYAPWTVAEDDSLADAAQRMAQERIGCLPVVDADQRITGLLSETDVLHALATTLWSDEVRERQGGEADLEALVDGLRRERDEIAARLGSPPAPADAPATRRLEALDRAIERAEKGRLAVCERCGAPIPPTRLRALPDTTLCIRCAGLVEGS
jgi:CBS domain-containing protein